MIKKGKAGYSLSIDKLNRVFLRAGQPECHIQKEQWEKRMGIVIKGTLMSESNAAKSSVDYSRATVGHRM